tara:strand:- start:648 stop:1154 length:507 start_codon:yes stop_codon:yes gene_type:complete
MVSSVELPEVEISIASIQHLEDAIHCWKLLVEDQSRYDGRLSHDSISELDQRNFLRSVILDGRLVVAIDSQSNLVGISTVAVDTNMLDSSSSVWNISDVWVDNRFRRKGIGGKMVGQCEVLAKSRGASEIRLQVFSSNQAASMMYGRLGYTTVSRTMSKNIDKYNREV